MGDHRPACQTHAARQPAAILRFGRCMLENGITVAKTALRCIQAERLARSQVDGVERLKTVLQLHAIRANVLDGRCPHRARDQGQVLQPGIAVRQRPGHGVVPDLASTRLHDPGLGRFIHQAQALDFHLEHDGLHVTGQDDVAAAAQHKFRCGRELGAASTARRSSTECTRTRVWARAAMPKVLQGCKGAFFSTTIGPIVASGLLAPCDPPPYLHLFSPR